jgi:signal transduction histidine kinase
MGLQTLDLARMHERALITLVLPTYSPDTREAMVQRAGAFFAETITPIETTHRIAKEANVQMTELNRTLRARSAELATSNRQLKREIVQRRLVEKSLKRSEQHYGQLLEQSRHMQEQLRLLSRQLLSAQEEERKKISRELHDVIAQTLTTINVRLAALKKEATFDAVGLERSIGRTQQLVQESVDIVHRFARELRPTVLDDLGLIPALHTFLKTFREETGICVSLSAFAKVEQVNGEKRTVLYRIAQEALTNVARHAHASQADVKIQRLNGAVCMTIKDNGKGFLEERVLNAKKNRRLGLLGMRERLEMVGGAFAVKSAPRKGTTVIAQIPLMNRPFRGARRLTHLV